MPAFTRILSILALLGFIALPTIPHARAAETDPAILAAVDAAIAAINSGSVAVVGQECGGGLFPRPEGDLVEVQHHGLALPAPPATLPPGDGGSRLARRAGFVSISAGWEDSERFRRLDLRAWQD